MESGNYAVVQVAQALAQGGVKLVPEVLVGGGAGAQRRRHARGCAAGNLVREGRGGPAAAAQAS